MMIGRDHPLIGVNDVFNGIFVNGNVIGDVMFYGAGQESFRQPAQLWQT